MATATNYRLELLAPAKNADFGIEAIKHGADAVYIGGPAFGARAAADNSLEDIKRLCDFAHQYHAQVFVTFNTILTDKQLAQAEKLIWQIYEAGADALIVQDVGVLQLNLPPIALHASTQMDNRDAAKVAFLEQVGFTQVVLARELSLAQIKEVAQHTQMQLEFFIHGALCVSYSGQCYISHAFTGRSANRGECSQFCRLPGNLVTRQGEVLAKDKHLLSVKDNNQTDNLEALIDAGIRSFKIEGRLKDISYVKNVTAHYRQALDKIIANRPEFYRSSHGRTVIGFTPDTNKSFNRGKTDYFVNDRQLDLVNFNTPKALGETLGKITKIGKDFIELSSSIILANGDGLCYLPSVMSGQETRLQGMRVNRAEGQRLYLTQVPRNLAVGTMVYRNFDKHFEDQLAKDTAQRKIAVKMQLIDTDTGIGLVVADDYGHQISVEAVCEKQPANDVEKTHANIRKQLGKLGNSDFELQQLSIETAEAWFLPASLLNGLRREGIEALAAERLRQYQRPAVGEYDASARYPAKHLSYLGNVANQKAREFYEQHGVIKVDPAYEMNQVREDVPLMITKHCLRYSFNLCPKEVPDIKAEPLMMEVGNDTVKLVFDCQKCEMLVVGHSKQ